MNFRHGLRIFLLWVVLALMALTAPAGFAQDTTFGLSPADFDLLDNTSGADSAAFDYTLNLRANAEGEEFIINLAGTGVFDVRGANPVFQITANGNFSDSSESGIIQGEARLVDNILYANFVDSETGQPGSWVGTPFDDVFGDLLGGDLSIDPDALGDLGGDLGDLAPLLEALEGLDPAAFITIVRAADEPVSGQNTAHFIIDFNFARFFSSPAFGELLGNLGALGGDLSGTGTSPAELAAFSAILGPLFEETTFTIEPYVSTGDSFLYRLDTALDMTLDTGTFFGTGEPPVVIVFELDVTMRGLNQTFSVPVPEGALIVQDGSGLDALSGIIGGDTDLDALGAIVGSGPGQAATPEVIQPPTVRAGGVITAGVPVTVQLDGAGATDLQYTAAAPNTTITVTARSVDGAVDTTLEVLDSFATSLDFNDDHFLTDSNLGTLDSGIEELLLGQPGSYTIRVDSFSGLDAGPVEVTLTEVGGAAVSSATTPTKGTSAEVINGSVVENGRFQQIFNFEANELVTISVRATSSGFDPRLSLFDPNQVLLVENDDHGTNDPNLSGLDSKIQNFPISTSGPYTIEIVEFGGDAGTFEVSVSRTVAGPAQVESLNATIVENGRFQQTFRFNAGEIVTITARDTSDTLDPVLTLLDSNLVMLAENDDHGGSDPNLDFLDSRIQGFVIPATGDYLIEVRDLGRSGGTFELTIERRAGG